MGHQVVCADIERSDDWRLGFWGAAYLYDKSDQLTWEFDSPDIHRHTQLSHQAGISKI
jgi:hypothetical protein